MNKDFDTWNDEKKKVHGQGMGKLYCAREIWWCSLGVNVGFEQDGTGKESQRPVLIMRGFSKQVCLIVPLTTSTKKNPYHVAIGNVDGQQASVIISQLRLIDTKRLVNKVAVLDAIVFETIRKSAKALL
ncbi:hypothetical protein A2755_00025 [Candidatus Wolfebacteria bacterium RIFCSPHIGHO2_01_FULL_48_22]|uniref:Uncharacterized protein n=1 Tax=Candidatus Wolfebacteria bacterium RIFCSPHIGHO2_01_FULL_48_22 TaxID=1802555 RepID=A0A1F8DR70_9BACT|nr:MAG: hypothetical protein A2755_00025 [Candidatus Wolfebacteria bacterium RIFCSPHIGHO2_01_FULL_48_22]